MAVTGQDLPGLRKQTAVSAAPQCRAVPLLGRPDGRGRAASSPRIQRLLALTVFSSLTWRIVTLNLVALAVLVTGIVYLNQWRAGLIDARIQSLRVQGEIIAAAIAASATVDSDVIQVDPERLLRAQIRRGVVAQLFRSQPRIPDQSRTRRAAAAQPRDADQDARPHLRSVGLHDPRQRSIYPRGEVIRSGECRRRAGDWWTHDHVVGAGRRLPALSGVRRQRRQALPRGRRGAQRRARRCRARRCRPPAGDLGRRAGAARARHGGRAAALDAAGRDRLDRRHANAGACCASRWSRPPSPSSCRCCLPAPSPARCAACRRRPRRCRPRSRRARRSPISPTAPTRSGHLSRALRSMTVGALQPHRGDRALRCRRRA